MFIINSSFLLNTYKTKSKIIKNYLINNGIPLLSQESGFYIFSETNKLYKVLDNAPFYIKNLK